MNGDKLRIILSQNIKQFRLHRGFSQAELAEKADISIPFLGAIERGDKWPHPDSLAKLASALNIEAFELLKQENGVTHDVKAVVYKLTNDINSLVNDSIETLNKIAHNIDH
ncbi:helix-turn-helix domain-containing protein [Treponema primitia]|uniref:helix-turn-helix domain-containing protein n=1 Tax=Treponema primitia TaxID=88058 RepID=UPI000694DC38|nr:helix-turn-helix transcriptional regulator [Treponema primitia]